MQSGKGKLPSSGKKGKEHAKRTPKKHAPIDSDSDEGSIQLSFDSDSDARGTKKSKHEPPRKKDAIRVRTPGSGKRREKYSLDLSDSDEDQSLKKKRRRKSSQSSQSEKDAHSSRKKDKKRKVQLKISYLNVSCIINASILFTTRKDAFLETRQKSPLRHQMVTAAAKENVRIRWRTDAARAPRAASPRRSVAAAPRKTRKERYN